MVKHTQTIRRQIADELFKCVCPFCEIGAQKVNYKEISDVALIPQPFYHPTLMRYSHWKKTGSKICRITLKCLKKCFEDLKVVYLGDCKTSMMRLFAKIGNS